MTERPEKIDELLIHAVLNEVDKALSEIGERFGLSIRYGNVSYTPDHAQIAVEAARVDERGVVMGKDAEQFLLRAHEFGLCVKDLGREFGSPSQRLRIVGLKPRKKAAVICEQVSPPRGKMFALTARAVRAGLADEEGRAAAPRSAESDASVRAAVLRSLGGAGPAAEVEDESR